MWVAPNSLASSSFRASRSTAMIVAAPASRAPAMAASPTPPQPNTATESPGPTSPVSMAAPRPAITPQPSSPATSGFTVGRHLGALPGGDERLLGEGADAERGRQRHAVEGHLLRGVVGGEAVPGPTPAARPALAAHRPPVEDDEVARRDVGDAGADRLHHAGRLVAEQERELVVDAALPVVQVGVAHAAGLHLHERLARARDRAPRSPRRSPAASPPWPPPPAPVAPPRTPSSLSRRRYRT